MIAIAAPHAASRRGPRQRSRGVAALTVVMILFFVMALVAAYTNRNLMFEQRISANSYRANRALEAADAGVEWTVAMLNAGRVNANCEATVDNAFGDFRSRYLVRTDTAVNVVSGENQANGEGGFSLQWAGVLANRIYPACVIRDGALSCICPLPGAALPAIGAPADGIGSAFRIALILPGNAIRAGAMQFTARGCSNPGSGDRSCFAQRDDMPEVDGVSAALATVGLLRALPVAPIAPLTAGGAVSDSGGAGKLVVSNFDTQTDGLTVRAGDAINVAVTSEFSELASGVDTKRAAVPELAAAAAAANDGWFRGLFGMDPASYRQQPAVVRVPCAAGCTLADLNDVLAGYPRNPIWVDGNLNIDTAANLGSVANPLMLIVSGTLTVSANASIVGFVHANQVSWTSLASLQGALVTKTTFTATGEARLSYSKPVLDTVRLEYGSFVRVPGGWNLF